MAKIKTKEPLGLILTKLILATSLIVSAGALIGATGYLMSHPRIAPPISVAPIAVSSAPTEVLSTDDWQTYKNEEYGYEFKYPLNWEEKSTEIINPISGSGILFTIGNNDKKLSLDNWIKGGSIVEGRGTPLALARPVYINGVKVYKSEEPELEKLGPPYPVFELYISDKNNNIFGLLAMVSEKPEPEDGNILKQIFSTFKFVEKSVGNEIVTQKSVSLNGKTYKFVHYCSGNIKQEKIEGAQFKPVFYCLGENKLVFIGSDGKTLNIKKEKIIDASTAPILIDAQIIPSVNIAKIILVSYSSEPCSTMGDCGVGDSTNFATIVFDISKSTFRIIKEYPKKGIANWNKFGAKAVFYPHTCGGAGCDIDSLIGYNLFLDEAKNITNEQAAYDSDGCEDEVVCWSDLRWIDDNRISAIINYPDGRKKEINASF